MERLRAHTNEDACRPVDKKRVGVAIVVYQAGLEASGRQTEAATHIWMKVLSTCSELLCSSVRVTLDKLNVLPVSFIAVQIYYSTSELSESQI